MLESLKVDELKARLKKQGLSTTGRKINLIERLLTAPAKEEEHDNEQDAHGATIRTQLNKNTNAEQKAMLKGKGTEDVPLEERDQDALWFHIPDGKKVSGTPDIEASTK